MVKRLNLRALGHALRPLLILIWGILWFIFWITGSEFETGVILLLVGLGISVVLLYVYYYLWTKYPGLLLNIE